METKIYLYVNNDTCTDFELKISACTNQVTKFFSNNEEKQKISPC